MYNVEQLEDEALTGSNLKLTKEQVVELHDHLVNESFECGFDSLEENLNAGGTSGEIAKDYIKPRVMRNKAFYESNYPNVLMNVRNL